MGQRCVIRGCKNKGRNTADIRYHRFPRDPVTKHKWEEWVSSHNGKTWSAYKSAVICSVHFRPDQYINGTLLPDCVPSIAPVPINDLPVNNLSSASVENLPPQPMDSITSSSLENEPNSIPTLENNPCISVPSSVEVNFLGVPVISESLLNVAPNFVIKVIDPQHQLPPTEINQLQTVSEKLTGNQPTDTVHNTPHMNIDSAKFQVAGQETDKTNHSDKIEISTETDPLELYGDLSQFIIFKSNTCASLAPDECNHKTSTSFSNGLIKGTNIKIEVDSSVPLGFSAENVLLQPASCIVKSEEDPLSSSLANMEVDPLSTSMVKSEMDPLTSSMAESEAYPFSTVTVKSEVDHLSASMAESKVDPLSTTMVKCEVGTLSPYTNHEKIIKSDPLSQKVLSKNGVLKEMCSSNDDSSSEINPTIPSSLAPNDGDCVSISAPSYGQIAREIKSNGNTSYDEATDVISASTEASSIVAVGAQKRCIDSASITNEETISKKVKTCAGEMQPEDFESPTSRARNLSRLKDIINDKNRLLDNTQRTVRRLRERMKALESLFEHLKEDTHVSGYVRNIIREHYPQLDKP